MVSVHKCIVNSRNSAYIVYESCSIHSCGHFELLRVVKVASTLYSGGVDELQDVCDQHHFSSEYNILKKV